MTIWTSDKKSSLIRMPFVWTWINYWFYELWILTAETEYDIDINISNLGF